MLNREQNSSCIPPHHTHRDRGREPAMFGIEFTLRESSHSITFHISQHSPGQPVQVLLKGLDFVHCGSFQQGHKRESEPRHAILSQFQVGNLQVSSSFQKRHILNPSIFSQQKNVKLRNYLGHYRADPEFYLIKNFSGQLVGGWGERREN